MNIRTAFRGFLQRFGTEDIKRRLWNREYGRGRWDCLDNMADDYIYPHVEKYARNGSILDLGCGPGAIGNELNDAVYDSYEGVDISDAAIEKARAKNRRTDRNQYFQGDIVSYVPKQRHNVILFGDSIYYFRPRRVAEILDRYSNYLKPDGVFIVRSWLTHHRSRTIVHNIERQFQVQEKQLYHNQRGEIVVLILRPAQQKP
jgi:SAM-dependent methyltransferase